MTYLKTCQSKEMVVYKVFGSIPKMVYTFLALTCVQSGSSGTWYVVFMRNKLHENCMHATIGTFV